MKLRNLHTHQWLIIILFLSVVLRVGVALHYGDIINAPPLLADQRSYHALGIRLLEGHGYSFETAWYPFISPDTPTAFWSFLYSLFIAAVYAVFGVHPLAARLVQAVLGGILLPWMVYRLAQRLFPSLSLSLSPSSSHSLSLSLSPSPSPSPSPTPPHSSSPPSLSLSPSSSLSPFSPSLSSSPSPPLSPSLSLFSSLPLLAAALAAVYGYFILYAATLMTETFYIVALLWSLEVSLRMGQQLREGTPVPWTLALQLGLSLGIAALLRQSILPWAPVLFLWSVGTLERWNVKTACPKRSVGLKRWNVGTLLVSGLILVACIAPFTYRNYRVYGEFLLLNSNTGYAMYSAQNPMHGTHFREFEAAPLPTDLTGNEAQLDRELLRRGIQFVLDDPGRYLRLSLSRVRAYFEFWPSPNTTLLHNIGRVGSFGLYLPFMLYGLYLAIRHPQSAICNSLLYLFMIFYSLLHIFTWAMVRYRLPVDAVALPFAALAVKKIVGTLER